MCRTRGLAVMNGVDDETFPKVLAFQSRQNYCSTPLTKVAIGEYSTMATRHIRIFTLIVTAMRRIQYYNYSYMAIRPWRKSNIFSYSDLLYYYIIRIICHLHQWRIAI